MSSEREAEARTARLGPESIARTTFPTSRRGYDPDRVRAFLDQVARELRDARDREATLRTQLEALEARARDVSELDEARLTEVLGEETARVLTAAREAAAEMKAKGADNAARLLREAQEEASALKQEAESVLARKTDEAETEASAIRAAAQADADDVRAEAARLVDGANAEADEIRERAKSDADAEIEAAKARGREMIDEALAVRARVLEDLARKRKAARAQLERLQAGRERLLESYSIVRRTLDEATEELRTSLSSAKVAADAAARRVELEPMPSAAELEREVDAARDAGLLVPEPGASTHDVEDSASETVSPPAEAAPPDFVTDLPHEEFVPLEAAAEFEEVRLVSDVPAANGTAPAAVPEAADVVDIVEVVEVVEGREADERGAPEEGVDVDELFARLRAAREAEVERAQQVLADEQPADTNDVAEPAAAEPAEAEPAPAAAAAEVQREASVARDEAGHEVETGHLSTDEHEDAGPKPSPDDQALLERRDAITDDIEKKCIRKLKRVLADEQNEVLDRLRRKPKASVDDLFPAADEHIERYAGAARPSLVDVARSGGGFYGDQPVESDVGDLALELGRSLALPLRERIGGSLREAAGDEEAIADGVRAVYRDWKSHRIESQARDAVIAAFNRGMFDAIKPDTELRWVVDDGGSPCPDAEDNSLAGLVVRGEPFPTGHHCPPAHPGCRCLLVPAHH